MYISFWSQLGFQEGFSPVMEVMILFHDYMLTVMVIIMVLVSCVFLGVLIYRGSDHYILDSHFLEFVWTVIPMFFLLFMAFPSLYLLYLTEDISLCGLVVKVIAHQWYWEYEYYNSMMNFNSYMIPDSVDSVRLLDVDNRLCLPVSVGSMVMVTSSDVLHCWTVPSLGVKVDAIPGRLNFLNLNPSNLGVYYGQCSELCGTNHSFMPIVVEVTSLNGLWSFFSFIKS